MTSATRCPSARVCDFTAVQLASVYATIANGGVRVTPSIVAGTTDGHGGFIPAKPPQRQRVLQPRTSAQLLRILQWVPKLDIGPWGLIPGYAVAAKTGHRRAARSGVRVPARVQLELRRHRASG